MSCHIYQYVSTFMGRRRPTKTLRLVLAEIKELQIAAARNGSSLKPSGLVDQDQTMVGFDWFNTV